MFGAPPNRLVAVMVVLTAVSAAQQRLLRPQLRHQHRRTPRLTATCSLEDAKNSTAL